MHERLPTVARGMTFRGTARDNHPGAGAASAQDVTVNTLSCGPFGFTSQNSANTLNADGTHTMTLTWNTASACVTCNNVNVLFSTDGGATYPFTVLANTANDGTEIITVPNLPTCAGRFMIECSDNIFFNINAANQTITSACAANGTTIAPSATLSVAGAGDPSLNMSLTPLYGSPYANPITGNIETTDPASNLSLRNVATNTCASYSNPVHYDAYLFMPSVSGTYTFNAAGSSGGLVYNLYEGSYDASSPCANFLASSASVSGSATLTNTVSGNLCAQKTYVLLVTSFDAGTPALPASYTVNVSGPGTLYSGIAAPGGGISYSYVVVNNIGNVVSVSAAADMSNGAVYAAGDYRVYGISSSATAASLNTTYAGLPFTTLYNAALNQAGGLCASLSTNYRRVVIGTALPAQLLAFRARLKGARTALIDWQASEEADLKQYTLERSFDGQAFAALHARKPLLTAAGTAAYHYADPTIPQGTAAVWYRLQMTDAANRSFSSEAIRLVPGMEQQAMMAIAPNPVKGGVVRAQITLPEAGHYLLTIVDVAGRVVRTESRSLPAGSSTCMVGLPDLPAGVYALRLAAEHCVLNARFVVQ